MPAPKARKAKTGGAPPDPKDTKVPFTMINGRPVPPPPQHEPPPALPPPRDPPPSKKAEPADGPDGSPMQTEG
eukprot:4072256-Lingulodinium_polyedra.AAC.1